MASFRDESSGDRLKSTALICKTTVNTETNIKVLEQAQAARAAGNWTLLIQCLQQLVLEKSSPHNRKQHQHPELNSDSSQLLDLALEALLMGDFAQRWDIAKVFQRVGESAIAPLVDILIDEDEDEELRWFAARILGNLKSERAIIALVEVLQTTDSEELSSIAATSLGQIGSQAVAALTELLAAENTRLSAVRSLAYIRRSETISPLLSVVQDPQIAVRVAAIEALSSFHDARIPPVLLHALEDVAAPVRREAVLGLGFRPDLREELDLVNRLLPLLHDFNINVCTAAAIALGRLGTDAAATGLYQVLRSPYTPEPLQTEIIRALGRIGTDLSLEYLNSYLQQPPSETIYAEVVAVLGHIAQTNLKPKAAEILLNLWRAPAPATKSSKINSAIALSLGHLGDLQAIDPLIELLADRDVGVKLHAIAALKQLAPELAYQKLQQLATNPQLASDLQQGVAIALAEWSMISKA